MKKELILIKLIQNLRDRGFVHFSLEKEWWNNAENLKYAIDKKIYFPLIYSKEFADFFWGTAQIQLSNNEMIEEWKYRLKEMVLLDEPLEYIEKFLND